MQNRKLPSLFLTSTRGDAQGLVDGRICCRQASPVLGLVWLLSLSGKWGTDVDGSGTPFYLPIFGISPRVFAAL